jgi:hypothetical protein
MELVPTYQPAPSGLGKFATPPLPVSEQPAATQGPSPKIVVLQPPRPLARPNS